ncbi:MAG: hypothetical protein WAW96_12755 [Alphaproteobacteria bacterium]
MTSAFTLEQAIDKIESSYEFMLAYAAQGRDFESTGGDGPPIRQVLNVLILSLIALAPAFEKEIGKANAARPEALNEFCRLVAVDAERALTAVNVVLSAHNIGSQLIDNLNASMHLRTLLTDMFLLDEALSGASQTTPRRSDN